MALHPNKDELLRRAKEATLNARKVGHEADKLDDVYVKLLNEKRSLDVPGPERDAAKAACMKAVAAHAAAEREWQYVFNNESDEVEASVAAAMIDYHDMIGSTYVG